MHILLTDRLTCPRCGPDFGLILLAKRLAERRVLDGALGCPNCRDQFPIEGGFADLRPPPRDPLATALPAEDLDIEATNRLAALLGVSEGPGTIALVGSVAVHAAVLADRLPEIEVVAVDAATRVEVERDRVSRLVTGVELPFHPWTFRALATVGDVVTQLRSHESNGDKLPAEPLIAVNRRHVKLGAPIEDGDEVAFLPPLAGG